jgi:hypothetical protein
VICLQSILKPRTKVKILDPTSKVTCALGEICRMSSMTFHGAPITPGHVTIAVTSIKRRSTKLPFPSSTTSKVKDMANGVVLW